MVGLIWTGRKKVKCDPKEYGEGTANNKMDEHRKTLILYLGHWLSRNSISEFLKPRHDTFIEIISYIIIKPQYIL